VNFIGITDVNISIPLYVYVNSTVVKVFNASQKFNFTLNFSNPGIYVVFVRFPGNSLYKPAESNRIEIIVKPLSLIEKVKSNVKLVTNIETNIKLIEDKGKLYIAIFGILILLILTYYTFRYSRKTIRKMRIESSKSKYVEKLEREGIHAEMFEATNHPLTDIAIFEDGEIVNELQLKATESVSYINATLNENPDIVIVATSEVAQKIGSDMVIDSGIEEAALESVISDTLFPISPIGIGIGLLTGFFF